MGSAADAICSCGYNEKFMIGGGMSNFQELCLFPALCKKCTRIINTNMFNNPLKCDHCNGNDIVPYNQPELIKTEGSDNVAEWCITANIDGILCLTDGHYYCPACKNFTLTFRDGGIYWD